LDGGIGVDPREDGFGGFAVFQALVYFFAEAVGEAGDFADVGGGGGGVGVVGLVFIGFGFGLVGLWSDS
jgi:hypothetical protein